MNLLLIALFSFSSVIAQVYSPAENNAALATILRWTAAHHDQIQIQHCRARTLNPKASYQWCYKSLCVNVEYETGNYRGGPYSDEINECSFTTASGLFCAAGATGVDCYSQSDNVPGKSLGIQREGTRRNHYNASGKKIATEPRWENPMSHLYSHYAPPPARGGMCKPATALCTSGSSCCSGQCTDGTPYGISGYRICR